MQADTTTIATKPLVSIIVPVYNAVRYLDECVQGLLDQSYRNIEIVLVDDGSTDGSSAKCDAWMLRDNRIRVVHKRNQGPAAARNNGLGIANGEYITYVDSDDTLSPEYIEKLLQGITEDDVDLFLCSYRRMEMDGRERNVRHFPEIHRGTLEDFTAMMLHDDIAPSPWGKMYTAKLARQAYFDVGKMFEDTWMWGRIIGELDAMSFSSTSEPLYHYAINDTSISNTFHAEREYGIIEAWEAMCSSATSRFGSAMSSLVGFRRAWMWFEVLDRAILFNAATKQAYCDDAVRYLRAHADDVYSSDVFSNGRKLGMRVLSVSKLLYIALRKVTMR